MNPTRHARTRLRIPAPQVLALWPQTSSLAARSGLKMGVWVSVDVLALLPWEAVV